MKFSTKPMEQVTLMGSFSLTMVSKAERTLVAPCLSRNMAFIPAAKLENHVPVLMSSPPESKQTPFPTKATQSLASGFPL